MRVWLLPLCFALSVGVRADAKQDFFLFVNQQGGILLDSSAAGIMGGHHTHTVRIRAIENGFESSFTDISVDLVFKEFAKIRWDQVVEFTTENDDYFDQAILRIELGPIGKVHRISRSGSGKNVKPTHEWSSRSFVKIFFRTLEVAKQAAELAKKAHFEELDRQYGPLYRVFYNGAPMKSPSGPCFRIIDGVAYARVCSFSEIGVKTYNNNRKFLAMTHEGVEYKWPVGEKNLQIGDEFFPTEFAPKVLPDNLYYPVRDLMPRLGFAMSWDAKERILYVSRRGPIAPPIF